MHTTGKGLHVCQRLLLIALVALIADANADTASFYKCQRDNKVVFSQQPCPTDFQEHRLDYKYGVTTVTDNPQDSDPLQQLLDNQTLTQEEFVKQLDQEIFRLQQRGSDLELIRSSELQKLDRQRFWKQESDTSPEYLQQLQQLNRYYDEQLQQNSSKLKLLQQHKQAALADVDRH